jgi:DNA-directed RNA polymerase specialized sigma24 family protein
MSSHVLIQDPSAMAGRFSNSFGIGVSSFADSIDDIIDAQLKPADETDLSSNVESGSGLDYASIEKYLERIPPRESDLIKLYFQDKMKQEQIAKLFRITQAAVSYRLHRGIKRIQFLRTIPELEKSSFEIDLGPKFSEQDMEILWRMYETTCQSEIAKQMGLTQGRVRHRFFRSLNHIKELIREEVKEKHTRLQMLLKHGAKFDMSEEAVANLESARKELEKADDALRVAVKTSKYGKYWTVFYAISDKHFNILHEVSLPQFKDRGEAVIIGIE